MISFKTLAFSAALVVAAISGASAIDQSCTEVVFPNILQFGECLQQPQDLCHGEGSVAEVTGNIFLCGIKGISQLDMGSQLYLMEEVMAHILNRFGMGSVLNGIFALCRAAGGAMGTVSNFAQNMFGGIFSPLTNIASSALPLGDCTGLNVKGEIMCDQPVVFQFPSAFNIGKCLNTTMSFCVGSSANQAQVIEQFFKTVTCVFISVITNSPADTATGLMCTAVKAFVEVLNAGPFKAVGTIVKQMESAIGMQC